MTAKLSRATQTALDQLPTVSLPVYDPVEEFPTETQPGAKMTNAQSAWFELGRQIDTSIATYQQLAADCLKSWDYPGAARWRATAEGLETARNYMIQIARQTHDLLAATEAEKAAVGSATEAPPAGTNPSTVKPCTSPDT